MPKDKWNLAIKDFYAGIPEAEHIDIACELIDMGEAAGPMMLLGYPSREQKGFFLEYECEAYRRGYDYKTMFESIDEIAATADQWVLLAQFAISWEEVWPDCDNDGYVHYWIRKSDLAKQDFSQVSYTWERS